MKFSLLLPSRDNCMNPKSQFTPFFSGPAHHLMLHFVTMNFLQKHIRCVNRCVYVTQQVQSQKIQNFRVTFLQHAWCVMAFSLPVSLMSFDYFLFYFNFLLPTFVFSSIATVLSDESPATQVDEQIQMFLFALTDDLCCYLKKKYYAHIQL